MSEAVYLGLISGVIAGLIAILVFLGFIGVFFWWQDREVKEEGRDCLGK